MVGIYTTLVRISTHAGTFDSTLYITYNNIPALHACMLTFLILHDGMIKILLDGYLYADTLVCHHCLFPYPLY